MLTKCLQSWFFYILGSLLVYCCDVVWALTKQNQMSTKKIGRQSLWTKTVFCYFLAVEYVIKMKNCKHCVNDSDGQTESYQFSEKYAVFNKKESGMPS